MSNKLELYGHQVSGKAPKFTDRQQKYIYKTYSQPQAKFYQYLTSKDTTHLSYGLRKYIPQFLGIFTQSQILQGQAQMSKNANKQSESEICGQNHQINQQNSQQSKNSTISTEGQIKTKRQEWVEHINSRVCIQEDQKFLKMKNLTYNFKYPNIIDIKLGIKSNNKSKEKLKDSTTFSHMFRINGLSVKQFESQNENGVQMFMSKYYCHKISAEQMGKHLAFFFFDGKSINQSLLKSIIYHLKEIILGFKSFLGLKFMSSSIYIAYDAYNPQKYTINFIDFDKYQTCLDLDKTVEEGLMNALYFLNKVAEQKSQIEKQLISKNIRFYKQKQAVVPEEKVEKYIKRLDSKLP